MGRNRNIRLLTIGNSFAGNALTFLPEIAASVDGVFFEIGRANLGGCSLEKHSNLARFTETHPDYKPYRIDETDDGEPVNVNLQEALGYRLWDAVTLQQVSHKSWLAESYEPYIGHLHAMVSERAPAATLFLHQTWPYRSDSPFLVENCMTQSMMFERIRDNYRDFAEQYGCNILPSGAAVQRVRETPGCDFQWPDPDFDYQHAEPFELPEQDHSLAVGWKWDIAKTGDGIPELRLDANHLNECGCYLAGCVWFERLTGRSIYESDFRPEGIEPEWWNILRKTAHKVSQNNPL